MTADLSVAALRAAIARRQPDGVVIVHPTPVRSFAPGHFQTVLKAEGCGSMGRLVSAGDNAAVELLGTSATQLAELPTMSLPRRASLHDRELDRTHLQPPTTPSRLGKLTHVEYELAFTQTSRQAAGLTGTTGINCRQRLKVRPMRRSETRPPVCCVSVCRVLGSDAGQGVYPAVA